VLSHPPNSPLSAALSELPGLLLATDSFDQLMQQIADLAARTVPGAATSAITLAAEGRVITVAAADPLARLLDEHQYDLDEGPCLQALHTGVSVSCPDLARDDRWNGYPARALAHGVSAVHATPLIVRGDAIGALNLYGRRPHAFDTDSTELAAQLAQLATIAITGALRTYGSVTLTDQLRTALNTRSVIDQAIGILIATQHCTPDQALAALRGTSQNRNIRLNDVARDLVERTIDGTPDQPANST
jgi:GAF domain-containing protein